MLQIFTCAENITHVVLLTAAIRTDRQRGGRSSYDGCSPHGRPKPPGGAARTVAAKSLAPRPVASPYAGDKGLPTQPRTPQLLDDLTAIETLMSEDDNNQSACCVDKLTPGDTDVFGSLLHFADHCLYKIVRWARNLPDFSGVSVSIIYWFLLLRSCQQMICERYNKDFNELGLEARAYSLVGFCSYDHVSK